ncbi:MAG: 14-3-3 protein [Benniella sp.]|nr:MAG: 14-3-3 protein [Benniella sp.]
MMKGYYTNIEQEMGEGSNNVLKTLEEYLIENTVGSLHDGFPHRLATGDKRKRATDKVLEAYAVASAFARELSVCHPVRLGLALHSSVFSYDNLNSPKEACHLAKQVYDDAMAKLDTLSDESCKDAMMILQLLERQLDFVVI